MNELISVLIPTRGRANKLQSLITNIFDTCFDSKRVEVCFYVDEDDLATKSILKEYLHSTFNNTVFYKEGPRVMFSDLWNQLIDVAAGDILMICGDDVLFETQNWDQRIREEFDKVGDKILYVNVNDKIQGSDMGAHGFLHRKWVDCLGYITPNMFIYYYSDNWITDISKMINRRVYLEDVIVGHTHWSVQQSQFDTTYRENQEKYNRKKVEVDQLYIDTLPLRQESANKLLQLIAG